MKITKSSGSLGVGTSKCVCDHAKGYVRDTDGSCRFCDASLLSGGGCKKCANSTEADNSFRCAKCDVSEHFNSVPSGADGGECDCAEGYVKDLQSLKCVKCDTLLGCKVCVSNSGSNLQCQICDANNDFVLVRKLRLQFPPSM